MTSKPVVPDATTLFIACRGGDLDEVIRCLDSGVPVSTAEELGFIPHKPGTEVAPADMALLLQDRGALAQDRAVMPSRRRVGFDATPLHDAAWGGHLDVIKLLLDFGADRTLKCRYKDGRLITAEQCAMLRGNNDAAQLLREYIPQRPVRSSERAAAAEAERAASSDSSKQDAGGKGEGKGEDNKAADAGKAGDTASTPSKGAEPVKGLDHKEVKENKK